MGKFIILLLFFSVYSAGAKETLVLIKAISNSGKSFVINRGAAEGIEKRQTALFSTQDISVVAVVTEINRHFSLWEVKNRKVSVGFKRGETVVYSIATRNTKSFLEKPDVDDKAKAPKKVLKKAPEKVPKQENKTKNDVIERLKRRRFYHAKNFTVIRGHYSYALSESISEASEQKRVRAGVQLEALFAQRISPIWEYAVGVRIDRENSEQKNPALVVPTNRTMLLAEVLYHFLSKRSRKRFYLGGGIAYGISKTTVNKTVLKGSAWAIPIAKVGYIKQMSPSWAIVWEGSFEALASDESFNNFELVSESQSSNMVNVKLGVGIRF